MTFADFLVLAGTIIAVIVTVLDLLKHPLPGWVLGLAVVLIGAGVLDGATKLSIH
jgi:uncharacterized membrane protein AbrB (regulator of aidB expression)